MRERRYGGDTRSRGGGRGRHPSPKRPPPGSGEFNPLRYREYSPSNRRDSYKYFEEMERSQRIERNDHFGGDFISQSRRFSDYDVRVRDRHGIGDRRSRSPQRRKEGRDGYQNIDARRSVSPWRKEKSDYFDREMRGVTLYDDGGRGRDQSAVGVGRSCDLYGEYSRHRDSSPTKIGSDHLVGGPKHADRKLKGYNYSSASYRAENANATKGAVEQDYFPENQYLDRGRTGLLSFSQYLDSSKPITLDYNTDGMMNADSYRLADGSAGNIPKRNLAVTEGSSHMPSVTSRYLNTDADQQGYFHFRDTHFLEKRGGGFPDLEQRFIKKKEKKDGGFHFGDDLNPDKLGMERLLGREKYAKENNLLSSQDLLKSDLDSMAPACSKDYDLVSSSILRQRVPDYPMSENINVSSTVNLTGTGLTSEPRTCTNGYSRKADNMLSVVPGVQFDVGRNHSRSGLQISEAEHRDYGRRRVEDVSRIPKDINERYRNHHISGIGSLDPILGESSHQKHLVQDGIWDPYTSSCGRSTPDKFDAYRSLHARKQDFDMLGTESSHLNYGDEVYHHHESVKPDTRHTELDGDLWSREEIPDPLESRENYRAFSQLYDSPKRGYILADLSMVDFPDRKPQKYERGETFAHGTGISITSYGNGVHHIYNRVDEGDEMNIINLSKKTKFGKSKYMKKMRTTSEAPHHLPSSSKIFLSRSHNYNRTDSRDIKKRLGPVPRKLHVSQRLVKKYKPSVKKRLAPGPGRKHATVPWIKTLSNSRVLAIQDDPSGDPEIHDEEQLVDHPTAKPAPSEKSEDFKQLVQSAFFKFLKQIYETPSKRKKYMEQGKAGSLKCIVCGRNSEEYVDTESLVMHAFTCEKVGFRPQHLGLHKALCLLMGWRTTEDLSSEWYCDIMPSAEAASLKEDFIIWPPVVIVHNSTIDYTNPDERVIVSAEKLDAKLRGLGFGSILKVCNGKPANQSVILVKFNGTLSGLQEAERLHQSYAERKHGRDELKQVRSSKNEGSSGDTLETGSDKEEKNFLYGFLGVSEDLDKLDFDTKKRCVLRSKKDILSIVDATAGT